MDIFKFYRSYFGIDIDLLPQLIEQAFLIEAYFVKEFWKLSNIAKGGNYVPKKENIFVVIGFNPWYKATDAVIYGSDRVGEPKRSKDIEPDLVLYMFQYRT